MKKIYSRPIMKKIIFTSQDIITTSGGSLEQSLKFTKGYEKTYEIEF